MFKYIPDEINEIREKWLMNLFSNLVRADILMMNAYLAPKRNIEEDYIWLDANENPWDLSCGMHLNRYPESQPSKLIQKLSHIFEVVTDQILVSRGSDEMIEVLIKLCCRPATDNIMINTPTFDMFTISAQLHAVKVQAIPLNPHFQLDIPLILKYYNPDTKLIFIASPNNPTGNLIPFEDILFLYKKLSPHTLLVVDEAYIQFSKHPYGMKDYLKEYPFLVILRTLSKAYGLAGLRCGMALAHPSLINLMRRVIAPYPIANLVEKEALRYLKNETMQQHVQIIIQEREKLITFLKTLPFVIQVWPSDANFILIKVEEAEKILAHCLTHRIILRDRSAIRGLENCIRITVGKPEENLRLMEVMSYVKT